MTVLTDPPVRKDGKCARDGCGRLRKVTKQVRKYAGDQIDFDPFCSTECCRKFHGLTWRNDNPDEELTEKRAEAGRRRQRQRRAEAGIAA